MSRYARLSYVWVHLLLLPGLALGLTIRHFINAMLLLLVIWSIGYCLLRLLQRFVLHGNDPIFTNLGWPKLVYCIFLAFAAYALYSFTLFLLSDDPDVQNLIAKATHDLPKHQDFIAAHCAADLQ